MKIFTALLTVVLILNCAVVSCFAAFPDVNMESEEGIAIDAMQSRGYILGFDDGTFRPDATLTRAEFVTIINRMYKYYVQANNIFKDVKDSDWFYSDVLVAVQAGYINGFSDRTFRPDECVTREQVCKILDSILQIESNLYEVEITDTVSGWAWKSVEKAVSNGLFVLEEGGRFRATEPITRGEVCMALEKCIVDEADKIVNLTDRAELERILKTVINKMETIVIPVCTLDETRRVANMITDSLKRYLENPEHDYIADTKEVYEVYRKLTYKQADEIKGPVFDNMNTDELMILYNYFYDSDIDSILGEQQ